MPTPRATHVTGRDGWRAVVVTPLPADTTDEVTLRLEDGSLIRVAATLLQPDEDGSYFLDLARADLPATQTAGREQRVIPVIAERLHVETQEVEAERVRVTKQVHEREEVVDEPLLREEVHVERIPVNRYIDEPPAPHTVGETLVVPLVEEVLVVEKRLLLREELHITTSRQTVRAPQRVTLRREEATIERHAAPEPSAR